MSHHLEAPSAYSIDNLSALLSVSYLELLLKEYRCLLVGGLDDARDEEVIGRSRRRVEKRQEVYGLYSVGSGIKVSGYEDKGLTSWLDEREP